MNESYDAQRALNLMSIGKSVAEQDDLLDQYFIETEAFRSLVSGSVDIIAGDKGTGKSAIYRMLQNNYRDYSSIGDVEVLSAFNPAGSPVFQRLTNSEVYSEGKYRTIWKSYFLSYVGNWLIDIFGSDYNEDVRNLSNILAALGLENQKPEPKGIFSYIANFFKQLATPGRIDVEFSATESGMPIVKPGVEFTGKIGGENIIYCDDFLGALEAALTACGVKVWLVMDRLDEAFVGSPEIETPALRALLRTYLDFSGFDALKIKLFLRRDLFRRVTSGGFVNLSHINSKRIDIEWSDDDLVAMLEKRLRNSGEFLSAIGYGSGSDISLFNRVFPSQIDIGDRKPSARNWIMSRIQDGKGVKPPRNLIDLAIKSRENQIRREQRSARGGLRCEQSLFEPDAVREGQKQLSQIRVDDTLLAEAGNLAKYIEKFKDGKSEHNMLTAMQTIGASDEAEGKLILKSLVEMGFLEELKESYKIPMLYREGLNITQGKAFA